MAIAGAGFSLADFLRNVESDVATGIYLWCDIQNHARIAELNGLSEECRTVLLRRTRRGGRRYWDLRADLHMASSVLTIAARGLSRELTASTHAGCVALIAAEQHAPNSKEQVSSVSSP